MCQSAHILGRVLEHRSHKKTCIDSQIRFNEAQQLHDTLASLTRHLAQKYTQEGFAATGCRLVAISLCYSARLILYHIYLDKETQINEKCVSESEAATLYEMSLSGTEKMISGVYELAQHVVAFKNGDFPRFGPLICHTLYQGASVCSSFVREHGEQGPIKDLKPIIESLRILGRRWKITGIFGDSSLKR